MCAYILQASGSTLYCQSCRRLCMQKLLVPTGSLKAQQYWTLSAGMHVLRTGLSACLTSAFLSLCQRLCVCVCACMFVCVCVCLCALEIEKSRSQLLLCRTSMCPTNPLLALSHSHMHCTHTDASFCQWMWLLLKVLIMSNSRLWAQDRFYCTSQWHKNLCLVLHKQSSVKLLALNTSHSLMKDIIVHVCQQTHCLAFTWRMQSWIAFIAVARQS